MKIKYEIKLFHDEMRTSVKDFSKSNFSQLCEDMSAEWTISRKNEPSWNKISRVIKHVSKTRLCT